MYYNIGRRRFSFRENRKLHHYTAKLIDIKKIIGGRKQKGYYTCLNKIIKNNWRKKAKKIFNLFE